MFAAATREVVFANPDVVRRINSEFVPVALKAALVNNPPPGPEGDLYAEIARSRPAPQGICTTNSDGKVLAWALSFDDDSSIPGFLDHVLARYQQSNKPEQPVIAERFRKYPSVKLADVADRSGRLTIPDQHPLTGQCPGTPDVQPGTLVGSIIGRALSGDHVPLADTVRQEHYMEARLEIPAAAQQQLLRVIRASAGEKVVLPQLFADAILQPAFLGQLDVNPSGTVPGSANQARWTDLHAQHIPSDEAGTLRARISGYSNIAGGPASGANAPGDGRHWEHRVTLQWHGFVEFRGDRMTRLAILAEGDERLRWGNAQLHRTTEPEAAHLMAGHAIDLDGPVRYGLIAESPPLPHEGTN